MEASRLSLPLSFDPADLEYTPLTDHCPREAFSCDNETVDRWFHEKACSHHDGYRCRVTVVTAPGEQEPVAFYALGIAAVKQSLLNQLTVASLFFPSRDQFAALHIEWLGVRHDLQGNGLGTILMGRLLDTFYEAVCTFGIQAMTLQAINERTQEFYYRLGFRRYGPDVLGRRMLIGARPIVQTRQAVANESD